jgi:hypothetical protein
MAESQMTNSDSGWADQALQTMTKPLDDTEESLRMMDERLLAFCGLLQGIQCVKTEEIRE